MEPRRGTVRERLKKIKMMHRCCYLRCDCVMEVCWLAAAPRQLRRHIIAFLSLSNDDDLGYVYASHDTPMIWIIKKRRKKQIVNCCNGFCNDARRATTANISLQVNNVIFEFPPSLLSHRFSIVIYDFHLFDLVLARASSSLSSSPISVHNFLMWICHNSTKSFH